MATIPEIVIKNQTDEEALTLIVNQLGQVVRLLESADPNQIAFTAGKALSDLQSTYALVRAYKQKRHGQESITVL